MPGRAQVVLVRHVGQAQVTFVVVPLDLANRPNETVAVVLVGFGRFPALEPLQRDAEPVGGV
jgi:hypothetical protein